MNEKDTSGLKGLFSADSPANHNEKYPSYLLLPLIPGGNP